MTEGNGHDNPPPSEIPPHPLDPPEPMTKRQAAVAAVKAIGAWVFAVILLISLVVFCAAAIGVVAAAGHSGYLWAMGVFGG